MGKGISFERNSMCKTPEAAFSLNSNKVDVPEAE